MMSEPKIIKNPKISVEKRPGKNYIKTPLSEWNEWPTAEGIKRYGGIWYKVDTKSSSSLIVEKIFNDRVKNRKYEAIAKSFEKGEDLHWTDQVQYVKSSGRDSAYFDSVQMINKIDINSLYGAMGNRFFHLYDLNNAINITLSGQHLIKYLAENFNSFFRNEFWKNKKYFNEIDPKNGVMQPVVKIIETDSVTGDTIVTVNGKDIKIEDLFAISEDKWYINTNQYGVLQNAYTQSVNTSTQQVETQKIKYVMKHEVEKEIFEIKINGKSVKVTADHSIMVKRNNQIIEAKPLEIQKGDLLLYMKEVLNEHEQTPHDETSSN